jgi:hypothetical protein
MCVGNKHHTNRELANNQEATQYYTISELTIPMLRIQVT